MAIAEEVDARRVIDIGCGIGSLAVRLAGEGLSVVGVDLAGASPDVAKTMPNAPLVTWVHGDATDLIDLMPAADLALMTGNVAPVFVSDHDWSDTLAAMYTCLRPGGWLAFETRRPEFRDWLGIGGEDQPDPARGLWPGHMDVYVSRNGRDELGCLFHLAGRDHDVQALRRIYA